MILPAQLIQKLGLISPCVPRGRNERGLSFGLGPCSYDVCIAQTIRLYANEFALASTIERFRLPLDIMGQACDKSTWARQGLAVQNTILDPGWEGHLTLELTNHGQMPLFIRRGDPICQIVFYRLEFATDVPYAGRYQNQGPEPQEAA